MNEMAYGGHEEFFDFINGSLQFDFGSIFRILDSDKYMQLVVQMFPIRFASILLLLLTNSMETNIINRLIISFNE